jgi:hypothetical protein
MQAVQSRSHIGVSAAVVPACTANCSCTGMLNLVMHTWVHPWRLRSAARTWPCLLRLSRLQRHHQSEPLHQRLSLKWRALRHACAPPDLACSQERHSPRLPTGILLCCSTQHTLFRLACMHEPRMDFSGRSGVNRQPTSRQQHATCMGQ